MQSIKDKISIKKLNLLVSKHCNLHCKMCDYPIAPSYGEQLTTNEIKKLLSDASEIGLEWLEISGGEPMLRKDIYEIISYAHSFNIKTIMMTNGILIGIKEVRRLIDSGLNEVAISLEGFAEINDKIRGNGNFDKVMDTISNFKSYQSKIDCLRVGVTISKYNYNILFSLVKFLHENIGLNSISLNPFNKYMLTPENYQLRKNEFDITSEELPHLSEQLERIIEYCETKEITYLTKNFLRKISQYFAGSSMIPESGCNQPLFGCPIDAYGRVFTCWGEVVCVGNIKVHSIKEIVKSDQYEKLCMNALNGKCKGCLSTCYVY